MKITCSNARPSSTDVDFAVDVDMRIEFNHWSAREGSVTLIHNRDNNSPRSLVSWGSPDHWVSGRLLQALREIYPDAYLDNILQQIEQAALACAVEAGLA